MRGVLCVCVCVLLATVSSRVIYDVQATARPWPRSPRNTHPQSLEALLVLHDAQSLMALKRRSELVDALCEVARLRVEQGSGGAVSRAMNSVTAGAVA